MTKEQLLVDAYRKNPIPGITAEVKSGYNTKNVVCIPGISFRKGDFTVIVHVNGIIHASGYGHWSTDDLLWYLASEDKYKDLFRLVKCAVNDFKIMESYEQSNESILFNNSPENDLIHQTCMEIQKSLPEGITVSEDSNGVKFTVMTETVITVNTDGSIACNVLKELEKTEHMTDIVKKTIAMFEKNKKGMTTA